MEYHGASCTAGLASFSAISLHDISASPRPPQCMDADAMLAKATSLKRSADQVRGRSSAPWTASALCLYLESAVAFMEACEAISRAQPHDRGARLASLYGSTAALLAYTAKAAEAAVGPSMARHALRVLAERLCAVCQLREAAAAPGRFADAAAKAKQLVGPNAAAQQRPQSQAEAPSGQAGQASQQRGEPESSQPASQLPSSSCWAGPGAPPVGAAAAADSLRRLLEKARQVARFSDAVMRSAKGLEAITGRPEFAGSRQAQLASLHMGAVSMDGVGGHRLLCDARRATAAIACLCAEAAHR